MFFFCFLFYRFSCLLTVYFFVFIHRCVILSCTCVLLVSIAVLLHVSILAVLLAFYMCPFWQSCGFLHVFTLVLLLSFYRYPFWQYRCPFTGVFFLAVSQSFYSLFTGVLFGSIAVLLYVIFASITIFLHVSF